MTRPGRMLVSCPTCGMIAITNREGELNPHSIRGLACPGAGLRFDRLEQYRGALVPGQEIPQLQKSDVP